MMIPHKINFSKDYIESLIKLTDKLKSVLIKNNFFVYIDLLEKIKIASLDEDELNFINLLVNNSLFGGSGALWEIYIDDEKGRIEFINVLCKYIDQIKLMGINNDRINQVREILPQLL